MSKDSTVPAHTPHGGLDLTKWNEFLDKQKKAGQTPGRSTPLTAGTKVPMPDGSTHVITHNAPSDPTNKEPPQEPAPVTPDKLAGVPQEPDPKHPDVYVPPNAPPGRSQQLLRWDPNVGAYCVIGFKRPDGSWKMYDAKDYKIFNAPILGEPDASDPIPPGGNKEHPDFTVPQKGDALIMRWDPKKGKYIIVGERINGEKVMFPNMASAHTAYIFETENSLFGPTGPRQPLPAPTYGTMPPWGGNSKHPSFIGDNDLHDGKRYLWAWDENLKRYVAIGEANDDGMNSVKMYDLNGFRNLNSGPNALRPDQGAVRHPIPDGDPAYSIDQPHSPPEQLTILRPPEWPQTGSAGVSTTGQAIYRTNPDTGEEVIVGIIVKGDQKADPPIPDKIIYLRPDEYDLYNPGGKARTDLPVDNTPATQPDSTKPDAAPANDGDVPPVGQPWTEEQIRKLREWNDKQTGNNRATTPKDKNEATFIYSHGFSGSLTAHVKVGTTNDQKTIDALKEAGYPPKK